MGSVNVPNADRLSSRRNRGPYSGRKLQDEVVTSSRSLDSLPCTKRKSHLDAVQGYGGNQRRRASVQSDVVKNGVSHHTRTPSSGKKGHRRVNRSASAVSSSEGQGGRPLRRASSEGPRPREQNGSRRSRRHRNRGGASTPVQKSGSRSTVASDAEWDAKGGQTSLTELCAVEMRLSDNTVDVGPKESRRRRVVFAVVLVALALLTASVLLVAITLFMSPSVDEVVRKENENLFRLPASTTVLTTAAPSMTLPDNATTLTAAG